MKLIRLMLIASVLLTVYVMALAAVCFKYLWICYVIALLAVLSQKGKKALTSHGTSRWADSSDMKGMIDE